MKRQKLLGVSTQTLRRWDKEGRLPPAKRTFGSQRRYDIAKIRPELFRTIEKQNTVTVAYARISSHDQKEDLSRQIEMEDVNS